MELLWMMGQQQELLGNVPQEPGVDAGAVEAPEGGEI